MTLYATLISFCILLLSSKPRNFIINFYVDLKVSKFTIEIILSTCVFGCLCTIGIASAYQSKPEWIFK